VNSQKLNAIIRISASVEAVRRSRCRPRRSEDCTRTTSSWQPRSIVYSLARPRGERVQLAATCTAFLLIGPTGSGKTLLAQTLARESRPDLKNPAAH
jgi:transcriptional regulator with AAA-type ATPase domain